MSEGHMAIDAKHWKYEIIATLRCTFRPERHCFLEKYSLRKVNKFESVKTDRQEEELCLLYVY